MLPRVKILFENGLLGGFVDSEDGLLGLVCTGAIGEGLSMELGKPFKIRSLKDLEALGFTSTSAGNERLYKNVKEFYSEAEINTALWVVAYANTYSLSDLVSIEENTAQALLDAHKDIKGILVDFQPATGYTAVVENALDKDVSLAIINAQKLAAQQTEKFAPVFVLIAGQYFTGAASDLADLKLRTDNRVGIVIGDNVSASNTACVGLIGGRISRMPVQRHLGRTKDGAISASKIFIKDIDAETADVTTINDLGYITFRTFVGKAGYFVADDNLATKPADDYRSLARRRTVDKAFRIAYTTLIEELNDEIPVTNAGTITPGYAKHIEKLVEDAIVNQMTAQNNLGVDPNDPEDKGVKCYVNYNQNIVTNSRFEAILRVKPYGYAKYIDVKLGFLTTTE